MLRQRCLSLLFTLALLLPVAAPAAAKDLAGSDVGVLAQALALLDEGKAGDARDLAKSASDPLVAELVLFFDLSRRGMPASYGEISAFLQRHPDWPMQRTLATKAEAVLPAGLDVATTASWFDRYRPATGQGAFHYVDALAALGRSEEAKAAAIRLWRELPLADAQEALFLQRYGSWLAAADEAARLSMLLDAGLAGPAERQAPRAGAGYPELAAARLALQEGKKNAVKLYEAVPETLRGDGGLQFDLVGYYWKKDRYSDLAELFAAMGPENGGRAAALWSYRFGLAGTLVNQGKYKTAYRVARDHGLSEGVGFAELEWLAGHIALRRLEDPATALRHFARYYEGSTTPISRGKGAYWAGIAAEAQGEAKEARRWLTLAAANDSAFYGQLAAARLGLDPGANVPATPALDAKVYQTFAKGELAKAVKGLAGTGDRDRTRLFFHHLLEQDTTTAHYLAAGRLGEEIGRWDLVVDAGKEARRKGLLLTDLLFPIPPLADVVYPEMALVLALIRQESEFDQGAVSSAGAKGLMQLMPATAKGVAKQLGLPYSEADLTADPDYNVTLGTTYLAGLLDQFDGSYVLSLAGYNAGPHRATTWIERNGDPRNKSVDMVEWIESIPFYETRNYVMRVTEAVVVYRHLLGLVQVAEWEGYNPASGGPDGARLTSCCDD